MIAKIKKHLLVQSSNEVVQRNGRIALFIFLGVIALGVVRNLLFLHFSQQADFMITTRIFTGAIQIFIAILIFTIYIYLIRMANQFADSSEDQAEQLEKVAQHLQKIAEVAEYTHSRLNVDKVFSNTVTNIREQFDFCLVCIFLLDEEKEHLVLKAADKDEDFEPFATASYLSLQDNSIISKTAVQRKRHLLLNTVEVDHVDPNYKGDAQIQLAFPLIARNELYGILDIQSQNKNAFKTEDIAILHILANQIAINIDNARLFAETEARLNETRALYDFNLHLSATNDLGEIYRRSAREFAKQLNGVRCVICSVQTEDEKVLITQADYWHSKDGDILDEFHPDTPIYHLKDFAQTNEVLTNQEPYIYQTNLPDSSNGQECLEIPLIHGGASLGIVRVYREFSQPLFRLAEIQLAQAMANQAAVSLTNTHLTAEAQGRVAQLSTLYRMSLVLSEANNLREVFEGGRREILSLISASGMSIVLVTPDEEHLDWIYAYEYGQEVNLSGIDPIPISQGFSGHVYRTQDVLYIKKDDKDIEKYNSFIVGADLNTWLGLPMMVAGRVIGVLAVESDELFSERDIELLRTIVGSLSIAINNLRQFEEIETALTIQSEQRLHLQTAAEIAAASASVLNRNQLISEAVELIKDRFQLYYVGIFLVDENSQLAILRAGSGKAGEIQLANNHTLQVGGQSLIGGATADGVPRIIQDVTQDKEWRQNPALPQTKSELALPLHVRNKIIGALTVQSRIPNLFTPEMISTLQTMSNQLAIAIENAQLLSQAEARAGREEKINHVSAQLHQSSNVDEIIGVGLQALSAYLNQSKVDLYLGKTHKTQTKPLQDNGIS